MSTFNENIFKGVFFLNHDNFDFLRYSFGLKVWPTAEEIADQCERMSAEICANLQKHFKVGLWGEK